MKRIIIPILLITTLLFSASCQKETVEYKNDVPVSTLAEAVINVLDNGDEMTSVPETYISSIMKIDTANFAEFVVYKQMTGATIDEYGIFKVNDTSGIEAAVKALEDYIDVTKSTSMVSMYMPEETPKLEGAEVKAIGEYVVYCILADEAKAEVFTAISDSLTVK